MSLAFPVTWVDHTGAAWTCYAHREGDLVICDDGTQLFPDGEGISWLHGHYTRDTPEAACLLVNYALEDKT